MNFFFSQFKSLLVIMVLVPGIALSQQETIYIQSKFLKESVEVWIKTPPEYTKTTSRFPVMLVFDAAGFFDMATDMNNYLSLPYVEHMPAMIAVGINKGSAWRAQYFVPDTVSTTSATQNLVSFLEYELLPEIKKRYRTDDFKMITGHSLSALFVTYVLATRPDLFNSYVAISPSLTRHFNYLWKKISKLELNRRVFYALSVAENDLKNYVPFVERLRDSLSQNPVKNLTWSYYFSVENDHYMVGPPALYKSMQQIFKPWFLNDPTAPASLQQIITHQEAMSNLYGYTINIEWRLIMLSRSLLGRDNVASKKVLDELQKRYSDSPLAARWLIHYYVEIKDRKSALQQLENYIARSKKITTVDQVQVEELKKDIANIP